MKISGIKGGVEMYSVSIIMPIFNNEKTLENSIQSILKQTLYDFELILINDGPQMPLPKYAINMKIEPLL